MRVPPVLGTPAGQAGVVALLSVVVAVVMAVFGAYGMWSVSAESWEATGTVTAAVSCAESGPEEVEYQLDGETVRAELDACGHSAGDEVLLSVTDDSVHLASARTGAATDARVLGVVLAVFAGMAGAGFVALYRRA
ncbi:hypothetical protein [Actinokineospora sp. NPDC004072]